MSVSFIHVKVIEVISEFLYLTENEDVALYPCPESAVDLAMALAQKCQLNSIRLLDVDGNEVKAIGEPEVSGGDASEFSTVCFFLPV